MEFLQKVNNYYTVYLDFHKKRWTRRFHFLGEIATIAYIIYCLMNYYWLLLVFSPIIIYVFAWPSHYFIEYNKPATLKTNLLISKICNARMCYEMLIGKIKF